MNDNNDGNQAQSATTEAPVKVVKHLDAKIADAREDLEKAQARLDVLLLEQKNQDRIVGLKVGDEILFEYGRGEKRRELTGKVIAVGDDEKQGRMLAVQTGEGLDIQTLKIRAADVLFTAEDQP